MARPQREPGIATAAMNMDEQCKSAIFGRLLISAIGFQEFFWPDVTQRKRRRGRRKSMSSYRYDPKDHTEVAFSQVPMLTDPVGSHSMGRGVGKSLLGMQRKAIQKALCWPDSKIVMAMTTGTRIEAQHFSPLRKVLDSTHGHPIFSGLVQMVEKDPVNKITLMNGSEIGFVSQGQTMGTRAPQGVQSWRASFLLTDETQNMNSSFWQELLQTQNAVDPFSPADQEYSGAGRISFGVPDGRQDTPFADNELNTNSSFRLTRTGPNGKPFDSQWMWKIPSVGVPWNAIEQHGEWLREYGCDPERDIYTDNYYRQVWGRTPTEANKMFGDDIRLPACDSDIPWKHLQYGIATWKRDSMFKGNPAPANWLGADWGPHFDSGIPPRNITSQYVIGGDPGDDVTSFAIWEKLADEKGVKPYWRWVGNVTLRSWGKHATFEKCTVLAHLIRHYQAVAVGIDATGYGHDFCGPLRSDPRIAGTFETKLREYAYSGLVTTRFEIDERAIAQARTEAEKQKYLENPKRIQETASVFSMYQVQRMLTGMELRLPMPRMAPEIHRELSQIVGRTSVTGTSNTIKFYPEHPHFVSGAQMAALAIHEIGLKVEMKSTEPRYDPGDWGSAMRNAVSGGFKPLNL